MSAPALVLRGRDGAPVAATLELEESSGPVSPRYQFATHLKVEAGPNGIHLTLHAKRAAKPGAAPEKVSFAGPLPWNDYQALWAELERLGVFGASADLVGPLRGRKGVSFNSCRVALSGHPEVRIDYLLSHLDDPQHRRQAAVIEALKQAGLSAAT